MKSSHQPRVICEVCWVAFVIEALSRPCCQNPLFSSLFFYFLRFFFHVPSLHPPDLPLHLPKPLLISDKLAWSPFSSCWALLWVPVQDLFFFFSPCFLKIMFATSSDCHSYSSDHRDLTTAFLFLLPRLSPTICHIFYVTESLAYPTICPALFSLLGRTPRGQRLSSALACSRTGC